jgi:hypothetical protein
MTIKFLLFTSNKTFMIGQNDQPIRSFKNDQMHSKKFEKFGELKSKEYFRHNPYLTFLLWTGRNFLKKKRRNILMV